MSQNLPVKTPNILDKSFKYVPAAATDIRKTLERFGFKPPSENKTLDKSQEL